MVQFNWFCASPPISRPSRNMVDRWTRLRAHGVSGGWFTRARWSTEGQSSLSKASRQRLAEAGIANRKR